MKRKKIFISFIVVAAICLITSLALYFLVDLNSHKPRIETAMSDALGLNVKIKGNIGFLLFPNLNISLEDIKVTGKESDIASLENVAFGLELLPLLKGKVIINEIKIKRPEISLGRFKNGEFNITQKIQKKTKEEKKDLPPFAADTISLSDGDIVYTDRKNETVTKLKGVDIAIKDLIVRNSKKQSLIQNLSFKGSLHSKKITYHTVELSDLAFQVRAKDGLYNITDLSTTLFSGKGKGEITFDVTGTSPTLKIESTLSKIHLEEFLHAFSEKKTMEGEVDLSLNLTMQGKGMDAMIKTMKGDFSAEGENLVLKNYDIDSTLSKYRTLKAIGTLDIGAFFLAGPLGTAVTKGYDYEKMKRNMGEGEGIMKKLLSVWKVEKGTAAAEDVAIATRKNRLALKGNVDLVNETYENIIVALINEKGCATLTQKIHGPLNNPQLEKTSVLQSAAGPLISLINRAGKLIPGAQCQSFYKGSVQHP